MLNLESLWDFTTYWDNSVKLLLQICHPAHPCIQSPCSNTSQRSSAGLGSDGGHQNIVVFALGSFQLCDVTHYPVGSSRRKMVYCGQEGALSSIFISPPIWTLHIYFRHNNNSYLLWDGLPAGNILVARGKWVCRSSQSAKDFTAYWDDSTAAVAADLSRGERSENWFATILPGPS